MDRDTLCWAAFVAVLAPLFLRTHADPLWPTSAQIAMCFGMVAIADRIEVRAR